MPNPLFDSRTDQPPRTKYEPHNGKVQILTESSKPQPVMATRQLSCPRSVMSPAPTSTTAAPGGFPTSRLAASYAKRSIGPASGTPYRIQPRRPASCTVASPPTSITSSIQRLHHEANAIARREEERLLR